MRFDAVLGPLDVLDTSGDLTVHVTDVASDTREVGPGALFCCVPGRQVDGHDLAAAAVRAGAVALLCERPVDVGVAQARVADVRRAVGPAAAAVHGHPDRDLAVLGVTGTNGKTTVTHLAAAIFEAHGWPTQVTGTMSGARTTPEAPEIQRRLAQWRDEGGKAAALEVSSAALVAHRVDGLRFGATIFTNFGTDHIGEPHPDVDSYFEAKASLFTAARTEHAVVNGDDPKVRGLVDRLDVPTTVFSMADVGELEAGLRRSTFRWRGQAVSLGLGGRFNVANAVAAATACSVLGVPDATIADGLGTVAGVRGHAEPVDVGQPFTVLVDYAHTPEAVSAVLAGAREGIGPGARVIVVFGCGGDRDRGKRPQMGAAAAGGADVVIVTSDNPRTEDPLAIIGDITVATGPGTIVEPDRAAAIEAGVALARPGDVLVIAGKGHEMGQTIGAVTHPFDDREVVIGVLREVQS